MNREEKNLQTRQKIIDSALREFGEKNYGEASLNTICAAGKISKGIIYHYFKDKDELYLNLVRECFDALTGCLKGLRISEGRPAEETLAQYFDARTAFFEAHPLYLSLFCHAVLNPPVHLASAVTELKAEFDALNLSVLTKLLGTEKLRPDITVEEVVEVFREFQDFVNTRFQMRASGESTWKEHEERCRRSLKILLYGVIDREV